GGGDRGGGGCGGDDRFRGGGGGGRRERFGGRVDGRGERSRAGVAEELRRAWWLGEIEIVGEVGQPRIVLTHDRARVGPPIGGGIQPRRTEEHVLDEPLIR